MWKKVGHAPFTSQRVQGMEGAGEHFRLERAWCRWPALRQIQDAALFCTTTGLARVRGQETPHARLRRAKLTVNKQEHVQLQLQQPVMMLDQEVQRRVNFAILLTMHQDVMWV